MKELSIEEKAKAYDEAIKRAKNFIENGDERERTIAESIFAGLMEESEDERIRKELLVLVKQRPAGFPNYKKYIAWLEKQGEQKPVEPNLVHHNVNLSGCSKEYIRGYDDGWNYCNQQHSQIYAEQNPAWSEEDYNEIETIACHLDNIGNEAMAESLLNIMDKYKSCRPQNWWKPSDEQMKALWDSIPEDVKEISEREMLLNELYKDLKKLKG